MTRNYYTPHMENTSFDEFSEYPAPSSFAFENNRVAPESDQQECKDEAVMRMKAMCEIIMTEEIYVNNLRDIATVSWHFYFSTFNFLKL